MGSLPFSISLSLSNTLTAKRKGKAELTAAVCKQQGEKVEVADLRLCQNRNHSVDLRGHFFLRTAIANMNLWQRFTDGQATRRPLILMTAGQRGSRKMEASLLLCGRASFDFRMTSVGFAC